MQVRKEKENAVRAKIRADRAAKQAAEREREEREARRHAPHSVMRRELTTVPHTTLGRRREKKSCSGPKLSLAPSPTHHLSGSNLTNAHAEPANLAICHLRVQPPSLRTFTNLYEPLGTSNGICTGSSLVAGLAAGNYLLHLINELHAP